MQPTITRGEKYVGSFVLGALILTLVYATVAESQNFKSKHYYYLILPESFGLEKGNQVKMNGFKVGEITEIELLDNNQIKVQFVVDAEQHYQKIRQDAYVQIEAPIVAPAIVPGSLTVIPGKSSIQKGNHDQLPYQKPNVSTRVVLEDITAMVSQLKLLVQRISDEQSGGVFELLGRESSRRLTNMIANVQKTVDEDVLALARMVRELMDDINSGRRSVTDVVFGKPIMQVLLGDQIQTQLERIAKGEAALLEIFLGRTVWSEVEVASRSWGTVFHSMLDLLDETKLILRKTQVLMDDVEPVLALVGNSTAQLQDMMNSTQGILADVRRLTASVAQNAEELPGLVRQTKGLLMNSNDLLAAFKRHWIISAFVSPPPPDQFGLRHGSRPNPYGE